jgi:sulfur carrier protein
MTATVEINGRPEIVVAEVIGDVLRARSIDPAARGLAVALNGAVVPRARWMETPVRTGDRIDIVRAFAGG